MTVGRTLPLVSLFVLGCLNSVPPENPDPDPSGTALTDGPSGPKSEKPTGTGRTGSCLLRLQDTVRIDGAPGLLIVALDIQNGAVSHAEYATNGIAGPTVGSRDDGGERLGDGEWGNVGVTLLEDRWEIVAKPKTMKLKISGDVFEMDGIPEKGKCAWK